MPSPLTCCVTLLAVVWVNSAYGQDAPANHVLPITLSVDGRYGVTVLPDEYDEKADGSYEPVKNPENAIVEIKTGRVIGTIDGDVAFEHMNHDEIAPTCWSADDSTLLWQVDGKWGFATEILISLKNGKIARQLDVLTLLQQEILKRTRAARPKDYAAIKANSGDFGSWFKDGFAIDCVLDAQSDKLTFPLLAHVFLTSNTKDIEGMLNLDSRMTAEVSQDGTIKVKDFHLGQDPPAREWGH